MQAAYKLAVLLVVVAVSLTPKTGCGQELYTELVDAQSATPAQGANSLDYGDLYLPLSSNHREPLYPEPIGWAEPVSYLLDDPCACEPSCDAPCACGDGCACCDSASCCGCGCGCCKGCGGCGCLCGPGSSKPNPCAASHKGVFYDNDFSYLKKSRCSCCLGDCMKQRQVGCCGRCGTVDVGGQLRMRYHHEEGMGQDLAGPGVNRFEETTHDFVLTRLRLYTNWQATDNVRVFVEGIFADATDDRDTYAPRPFDRNFGDLLNAFVDLRLNDCATVRVGRQELLYGAQRLVSPLDWANTRRTFEGVKLITNYDDWAVDAFYTHFVPVKPDRFDEADYRQAFYGTYATYSGMEQDTVELYYLGYDNENPGTITSDFSLHTMGSRVFGSRCDWLYELEGGAQYGRQSGLAQDHDAGFATAGIGRKIDHCWEPTIWFYYDYASGDALGGDFNRFNQLFPLAHKYFGFIDAVQRSNIEAPNVLLTMTPHKKVNLLFWYWHFMSNTANDIVPSIGGTPQQATNSKDFGDELDVIVQYGLGPRSNVVFGWSHLWEGNKILAPEDADFFYCQWELNF